MRPAITRIAHIELAVTQRAARYLAQNKNRFFGRAALRAIRRDRMRVGPGMEISRQGSPTLKHHFIEVRIDPSDGRDISVLKFCESSRLRMRILSPLAIASSLDRLTSNALHGFRVIVIRRSPSPQIRIPHQLSNFGYGSSAAAKTSPSRATLFRSKRWRSAVYGTICFSPVTG